MPARAFSRRSALSLAATAAASMPSLAGCAGSQRAAIDGPGGVTTLRYQGQVDQVLWPELAQHLGLLGGLRLEWIGNTTSGPQDIQATVTGDTDFGGAFNGAILRLRAAGAAITPVVSYYGTDLGYYIGFFVGARSRIRSPRDLIGATVGMNTVGGHSQDALDLILQRSGLTPEERASVQPVVVPPANQAQALRTGQLDAAAMTGAVMEKAKAAGGVRELFSDRQFLGHYSGGCYALRDEFIANHPDATAALVAGCGRAIEWARRRPREEVVATFADIIRRRGRNEGTSTVQYWRSGGVAGVGGHIERGEFELWLRRLEEKGVIAPGALRAESVYTNRFNPYLTT